MPEENAYDPECLPDLLPIYYKKLFPYGPYYRWLNYGGVPKDYFSKREFSFTLKDDIYIRYQSFSNQDEMEKEIQKRCPYKIDIGAVFSHRPKEHKTVKAAAFQAQEKELVFDIDMTDYDDVRSCCSGADICERCWPLMQIAIKIVDRALRDDFGFEHLLWVYSGRRGVHCWVCDETARKLSQPGRTAIAEYLSVVKGGENQTKKVSLDDRPHPSITSSLEIVRSRFKDYAVKKQDFLGNEDKYKKVLQLVLDEKLAETLEREFESTINTTHKRWLLFEKMCEDRRQKSEAKKSPNLEDEVMLQYCYPRLDVNVSKGVNHLLKSPFCIHPKTGRVCVPIDPENIDSFDPFQVPTVSAIVEELNKSNVGGEEVKKARDYNNTSLKPCIDVFMRFLVALEKSWKGKLIEQSDDFGFEHLLWVYSGRRGVHCWVCDETARKLSQPGRTAIAEYLSVVKGGENQTKKVSLDDRPHPSITSSLEIVRSRFKDYAVKKQDFLGNEDKYKKVLQLVLDEKLAETLEREFESTINTTHKRWLLFEKMCEDRRQKSEAKKSPNLEDEVMLQYCYPRLDVNVSKGVNHLLKSPFCIHPKTGRVCVPIDPENIDSFDPFQVPTVSAIVEELNKSNVGGEEVKKARDYNNTSLKPCIDVFMRFLVALEKSWKGKLIEQSDMKMEF